MSEQQPGAPAPAGGEPPAPQDPPKPATITLSNEAFNKRLEDERAAHERKVRTEVLKELGVEKLDAAKEAIAKASKLEQDSLTELEKRDRRIKELEPHQQTAERVGSRFKSLVDAQFSALPESAQKAIDKHAAGDAEKRFDMIEMMRESGALDAFSKSSETQAQPKPTPPTSVSPGTPPAPSGTPSKYDEWAAMKARSPVMGDIFYQQNQREIERTRPASA